MFIGYYCCRSNDMTNMTIQIEGALAYRIYWCARRLRTHFHLLASSRGFDLSQEPWFILNRLAREDGIAQGQLGDAVWMTVPMSHGGSLRCSCVV